MTTSDALDEADDSVRVPAFRVSKYLVISFLVWLIATVAFFAGEASGLIVPPIAVDAFMSLVGLYTPVFLVCVLLLLFLTRKRDSVDWERVFGANKATAMIEALLSLGYLLVTQLVLGGAFGIGLHYPGPAVYQTVNPSFNAGGVWLWALLNAFVYVVLPMAWLVLAKNFSMRTLWSSLEWRRDLWIIVAYWAFDFFGPILVGADDDFLGLTATQYLLAIPAGLVVNTLGAGLPVVVMMNVIFLPRIALACCVWCTRVPSATSSPPFLSPGSSTRSSAFLINVVFHR